MSNFDKAIKIIMAEPPEPRYPAYFADLLGKADVPDKDDGKCSEIPNSSETIYRQEAIDALRTCYDTETISMDNGDEYINYGDAVGTNTHMIIGGRLKNPNNSLSCKAWLKKHKG